MRISSVWSALPLSVMSSLWYLTHSVVSCPVINVMSSFLSQPPPGPRNEEYEEVRANDYSILHI